MNPNAVDVTVMCGGQRHTTDVWHLSAKRLSGARCRAPAWRACNLRRFGCSTPSLSGAAKRSGLGHLKACWATDGKSSGRAKLPEWIRSVPSCEETRYIQAIICPSHHPRRRETAGDPSIKSDRVWMRRVRTETPSRATTAGGHRAKHGGGLTWTTAVGRQGQAWPTRLSQAGRDAGGGGEGLCLAVFGPSI